MKEEDSMSKRTAPSSDNIMAGLMASIEAAKATKKLLSAKPAPVAKAKKKAA